MEISNRSRFYFIGYKKHLGFIHKLKTEYRGVTKIFLTRGNRLFVSQIYWNPTKSYRIPKVESPNLSIQSHDTTTTSQRRTSYVDNHIHKEITEMERNRGSVVSVTLGIRNRIRPHRTRVLHQPREQMRLLFILLILGACTDSPKQTLRKTIPVVDSRGGLHRYKSSNSLQLGNDYALYCMEHHQWETISVRYIPTTLSKLRSEEYIVRRHPKSG